jgi:hypothetical protein
MTLLGSLAAAREELARRRDANHPAEEEPMAVHEGRSSYPATSEPRRVEVRVKTYRNAKEYERDAPKMTAEGWYPEGQTGHRGKINMGRTLGKAVIFLPWAVMRPSRAGDPITVTLIRD